MSYKRLEHGRFVVPGDAETFELGERAFRLLLDGILLGTRGGLLWKWRMTFDAQASAMSHAEIVELLKVHDELKRTLEDVVQSRDELAQEVEWFKRQLFGAKAERRIFDALGRQLTLGEIQRAERAAPTEIEGASHRRQRADGAGAAETQPLRFDDSVPVE